MATILLVLGWRLFFYSNERDEPIHIHARKAETECKYWLRPELYEIEEAWSYNLTPRLRREVRKIIFDHFDLIVGGRNVLEAKGMQTTEPVTAGAIETTPEFLVLVVGDRRIRIPWEKCSERLAVAAEDERLKAELSPGGYGIHWPLIDEDLSVNGLIRANE